MKKYPQGVTPFTTIAVLSPVFYVLDWINNYYRIKIIPHWKQILTELLL